MLVLLWHVIVVTWVPSSARTIKSKWLLSESLNSGDATSIAVAESVPAPISVEQRMHSTMCTFFDCDHFVTYRHLQVGWSSAGPLKGLDSSVLSMHFTVRGSSGLRHLHVDVGIIFDCQRCPHIERRIYATSPKRNTLF